VAAVDQPGDSPRDDAGLSRTGPGHHEERTCLVEDRLALLFIDLFENSVFYNDVSPRESVEILVVMMKAVPALRFRPGLQRRNLAILSGRRPGLN
jgi:hypothetical protein